MFTGSAYNAKFEAHFAALEDYESEDPDISSQWRAQLLRKARYVATVYVFGFVLILLLGPTPEWLMKMPHESRALLAML